MPAATAASSSSSTTAFCAKTVEPEILLRPCRYLRSGSPDRINRFLVGMAEKDRRPCPKGTAFARGSVIAELGGCEKTLSLTRDLGFKPSSSASESVSYLGVSLSTGHGSRETESAEGRRLFLVTYRPSIRSSRAAGAKAVSGIGGSGENCVARLFGHAANPVEVDADEFALPFHHLAGDEHVLDVAGVH
jgi:hypothetical protein